MLTKIEIKRLHFLYFRYLISKIDFLQFVKTYFLNFKFFKLLGDEKITDIFSPIDLSQFVLI